MSKTKKLLIALMLLIAVLLIPNMVNATVEYTKSVEGNDGSITINLTGLELESEKSYQFSLVPPGSYTTEWHLITEKTNTTATIYLSSATTDIVNALKIADNAKLIIRENEDTTNTPVAELDVDLKLPYLNAVNVSGNLNDGYTVRTLYGYDNNSMSFNWEKITDTTVIEKYLAYKNNGTQISASDLKQTVPTSNFSTNWGMVASTSNYCKIYKSDIPDDGLYYLWIKSSDDNCKQITGYYIHDGLPNATTLQEYVGVVNGAPTVDSATARGNSGNLTNIPGTGLEYHPTVGDEITVNIKFNQAIVKNTAPKLIIKFGAGSNIELTTCEASSDVLTYKYTIKEGDLGTLQVVSFTGGNVTNNEGTAAVLTLPELSGYKVVAVEGDATPEEPEDTKKYISFPNTIYFGTTTIDLKQGAYDGDYTMYYQFVEVTNEAQETKYDDSKWVKSEDGKIKEPSLDYTGTKKFALWIKLEMGDKTVYEHAIYELEGTKQPASNDPAGTTNNPDDTLADKNLPNTGRVLLFWIIGIVAVSGIVARIRYKKLYM